MNNRVDVKVTRSDAEKIEELAERYESNSAEIIEHLLDAHEEELIKWLKRV